MVDWHSTWLLLTLGCLDGIKHLILFRIVDVGNLCMNRALCVFLAPRLTKRLILFYLRHVKHPIFPAAQE